MDRVLKSGWLALFAAPVLISATSGDVESKDTVLTVSRVGYGTAQGQDTFTVQAGSQIFATDPARAMRGNAEVLDSLRNELADTGIDKRDISTSNFQFGRGRDPEDDDDRAMGYIASQQLVVYVRNPDQAGAVIEALIDAGATDVSVQSYRGWWGSDRPSPSVESAARKQAVAELFKLHRLLAAISNNVNQIAKATNATGQRQAETDATLAAVRRVAERIDAAVDELSLS